MSSDLSVDPNLPANIQTTAGPHGSPIGQKSLGKEDFLKFLVAQMSHQDPMKPTDMNEMMNQLTQFSTIEQSIATNQHLQDIAKLQAANLIGKQVIAASGAAGVVQGVDTTADDLTLLVGEQRIKMADIQQING